MLTQPITAWLDSPDQYDTGLALLEQTGFSGFALRVLRMGDDAYNRRRVVEELTAYLTRQARPAGSSVAVIPPPAEPNIAPALPLVPVPVAAEVSSVDGLIDGIEQQIYPLMDERAALKSQLWAVQADDARQGDRRDWAYGIKRITRAIDDLYSQIDFVKQYGYAPPTETLPTEVDESALLMNVRTYVSRYRKKLKKLVDQGVQPTDPRFCATDTLLKQYLDQKNQIELKLSKHNDSYPTRQQT